MRGAGEGGVDLARPVGAEGPVIDEIAGDVVMQLRRARLQRVAAVGDDGQVFVIDVDQLRRVVVPG